LAKNWLGKRLNIGKVLYYYGKKVFLLFFLVLFCTQVFSSGITSYVVPDSVTLNQKITSTGVYEDGNNSVTGIKCSFIFE